MPEIIAKYFFVDVMLPQIKSNHNFEKTLILFAVVLHNQLLCMIHYIHYKQHQFLMDRCCMFRQYLFSKTQKLSLSWLPFVQTLERNADNIFVLKNAHPLDNAH